MPFINTAVTVSLVCWDTVNNVGKTGDASNITLRGVRDGTLFTPSEPSITQVDSTNLPGVYKASLTASENNGTLLTLGGKSSSTGCVIIPVSWSNELTGDAFARLGAPAGASVSADIAAVKSDTGATLADTNELQTDLTNGGRLDLLVDDIKAKTDNLPASPAAVGSAMTLTSAYDAAKSAASQASVTTLPVAIWNHLLSAMSTVGSIGQRLAAYFAITAEPAPDLSVSALKICNDALTLLGNNPIAALDENTKAARLCNQFYTSAVAATLRAYNWNCATARAELTADTEPPEFGFAIRYALPGDCLRVVAVSGNTHEWKIENGYILTNSAVVQIIYIKRISASEMDVMLSEAVAVKLASLIAFPLTNSATVAKAMFDLYKEKLADAHTMDAFENGTGEHLASDSWIHARGQ